MGLFNELGRKVEEFKRTAENAANSAETHQCPACGEQFDSTHERCPECGEPMGGSTETKE